MATKSPPSPNLTPIPFYGPILSHMMSLVYETLVESEEDLLVHIMTAAKEIQNRAPS